MVVRCADPCSWKSTYYFWLPPNSVVPWHPPGIGSRGPLDTQIHRCSSSLYKMVWNNAYSRPSASVVPNHGSKILLLIHSWLKSIDAKLKKSQLYVYWKILHISGSVQLKPMFKGQLYIHVPLRTEKIKYKLSQNTVESIVLQ